MSLVLRLVQAGVCFCTWVYLGDGRGKGAGWKNFRRTDCVGSDGFVTAVPNWVGLRIKRFSYPDEVAHRFTEQGLRY